jgi:hypothetical protein
LSESTVPSYRLYGCNNTAILFTDTKTRESAAMREGPFLNIKAPKDLLDRLDDYRFATRKASRAAAARELLDRALKAFFEVSPPERVRSSDPDYRVVRARRREPVEALPAREIETRLARLKKARAG